jgi:enoyl-CoA hydratase/carnithine racemase
MRLTAGCFSALLSAITALDDDEAVRVAILTGRPPAFCGGVDLADASDPELLVQRRRTGVSPSLALRAVRTPVIAAVNGAYVAGGLELALACDCILTSAEASFADPHVALGLRPRGAARRCCRRRSDHGGPGSSPSPADS